MTNYLLIILLLFHDSDTLLPYQLVDFVDQRWGGEDFLASICHIIAPKKIIHGMLKGKGIMVVKIDT